MISNSDMNEMTYNQMIAKIKELDDKVEKRKETCRKSLLRKIQPLNK